MHGVETTGLAYTHQRKLRTQMVRALGAEVGRACPSATLAIKAPKSDPTIEVPATVIGHWARRVWEHTLPAGTAQWIEARGTQALAKVANGMCDNLIVC